MDPRRTSARSPPCRSCSAAPSPRAHATSPRRSSRRRSRPTRSPRPCSRLARSGSGIDRAVAHVDAGAGLVERERVVHADEQVARDVREVAAVLAATARPARCGRWCTSPPPSSAPAARRSRCRPTRGTARAARAARESGFTTTSTVDGSSAGATEARLARVEALAPGSSSADRRLELHLGAVGRGDRLVHEVDVEPAGERHRGDGLRRADERQRRRVAVVAGREVAVERRHDRVASRPSRCRRAATGRCTGRTRWRAPSRRSPRGRRAGRRARWWRAPARSRA